MLAWPGLVRSSVSVGTPRRSRSLRSNATSNLRGFALLFRALVLRGKNRGERRERAALRGPRGCGIVEPSRTTADVIHETGDRVFPQRSREMGLHQIPLQRTLAPDIATSHATSTRGRGRRLSLRRFGGTRPPLFH